MLATDTVGADVFISYAREDTTFAARLKRGIQTGGLSVWMDTASMTGGERWTQEIESAIQDATSVVAGYLEPEMVVIQPGSFRMGDLSDDTRGFEHPVHTVTIAKPFAIGKYEVTFEEYDRFARAGGGGRPNDGGWGRGRRPVINVSWEEARDYASWLAEQTGKRYRLPTEAEWGYAARAGTETAYWWGEETGKNNANCDGCGSEWDGKQTAPAGSFKGNRFRLRDTVGNVWEWVQDCWHENYKGALADTSAWEIGDCARRVVRGGSWDEAPWNVRSALRFRITPAFRLDDVGFRLAQDL